MKMPGITISPSPNMAKLSAASPFSSKSWGNTTASKAHFYEKSSKMASEIKVKMIAQSV
jgi:hypothetical protein